MSCYKNKYESEGLALAIVDELINSGVGDADSLSSYKCTHCHFWHLTSSKR